MSHVPHPGVYGSVLETIGWTPMIRLSRINAGLRTPILVKAEFFNPGGSVKDRIAGAIIDAAERDGSLRPGGTIVEGTSGNTGVGLAIAAALKGYHCIFTMPDKMSQEKVRLLRAFGAEVVITPTAVPPDHPESYVMKAKQIAHDTPGAILANQFYNQANPEAHYATTGPEIWQQTGGKVTHFVAGAGTGGTVSGAGKYLKERNPAVRNLASDPVGSLYAEYHRTGAMTSDGAPYKVEGIGGDKVAETVWWDVIDEFRTVTDKDAMAVARRLAREEGLFVGGSSGANVKVALDLASEIDDAGACIVALLADTGERYLSKVFNDDWLRDNQLLDSPRDTVATLLSRRGTTAPELVKVAPEAAVRQALNLMSTYDVSQLPVIEGEHSVGALVEATLMQRALEQPTLLDRPVRELMDPPLPEVESSMPLERLAALLTKESPAALVHSGGRIAGIVSRYDILKVMIGR
ncbi:MAG TPA: pyridoxal-phosphate dependent enzyme [Gemmatimonadales bacterium]|nr:pyridoxal-phosphate dependent enzyme [Gemmatimonadales bacterium]